MFYITKSEEGGWSFKIGYTNISDIFNKMLAMVWSTFLFDKVCVKKITWETSVNDQGEKAC